MKKLVKYLGLLVMAAAVFSCGKESDFATGKPEGWQQGANGEESADKDAGKPAIDPDKYLVSFGATLETVSTKVDINPLTGVQAFEDADEVLVVSGSWKGVYVYDSEGHIFQPKTADDALELSGNPAYVYYPAAEFAVSGGAVTFTMPEAIAAGNPEDLGDKLPACGFIPAVTAGDQNVTFKSLGSIFHARFKSATEEGETITGVEMSGTGVNITGSGTISWQDTNDDGLPDTPVLGALDGTSSITVDCSASPRHLSGSTWQDFFFFLPPSGEFADMTIKTYYGKSDGSNAYVCYAKINRTGSLALGRNKILLLEGALPGFFSGGDGSKDFPYLISGAEDFKAISSMGNLLENGNVDKLYFEYNDNAKRNFFRSAGVHYLQTADIDFAEGGEKGDITAYMLGIAGANADDNSIKGVYDGGEHKISNFIINAPDKSYVGLFANSKAEIKNLTVENIEVTGSQATGGIVGWQEGDVTNCHTTGTSTITSGNATSGIAANIRGASKISGCTNAATINGLGGNVGGIVGYMAGAGTITGCTNTGAVSANGNAVGGILGQANASGGQVLACLNSGSVTNNDSSRKGTGGIVGFCNNSTTINAANKVNIRNEGAVSGGYQTGGIVGYQNGGNISSSYNAGPVQGTYNVGGIVGEKNNGNIYSFVHNESSGTVTGTYNVGGIAGLQTAGAIHGNLDNGANAVVRNEAAVTATGKDGSNYSAAGGIIGRMAGGTLGHNSTKNTAANIANVTGSGSGSSVGGLVGYMTGGTIRHCRSNATVINNSGFVGGAIGYMTSGTVEGCYAKGNAKASGNVGGFVGNINNPAAPVYILNCAAGVNVINTRSGQNDGAGGFIGYLKASSADKTANISNCVVWDVIVKAISETGTGSNKIRVGGFAGVVNGGYNPIQNCYYRGVSTQLGYGGTDDWTSSPTINVGTANTVIGGFAGYANGAFKDCYCIPAFKSGATPSGSNFIQLTEEYIKGTSATAPKEIVTSDSGTIGSGAAKSFGDVLTLVASGNGAGRKQLNNIELSDWASYSDSGELFFYPGALTDLGEDFYKK